MPSVFRSLVIALLLSSVAAPGSPRGKKLRLPEPDPMNGSIGVTIHRPKINRALEFSTKLLAGGSLEQPAVEVFFVKLEDGNEPFDATDLIPSNYANKRHVYLLNAEPGRYVAVAAGLGTTDGPAIRVTVAKGQVGGVPVTFGMTLGVTIRANSFFSMAMISDTEVTVVPQEMVFMGDYVVSMSTKMRHADEAQLHYYRLLLPGVAEKSNFARNLGGQSVYAAEIESVARDSAAERGFWTTARDKVFKGDPTWQALVKRQLAALSEQDPN